VVLKGLFNNSAFEIVFLRIKRQCSQNKDIDGTRSTKIHELEHFKFGARNYPNYDRATVKAQGDLHATNGKNKELKEFYSSLLLVTHSPDCVILCFQCTGFQKFPENSEVVCPN